MLDLMNCMYLSFTLINISVLCSKLISPEILKKKKKRNRKKDRIFPKQKEKKGIGLALSGRNKREDLIVQWLYE